MFTGFQPIVPTQITPEELRVNWNSLQGLAQIVTSMEGS